jgi:hypothetical protein
MFGKVSRFNKETNEGEILGENNQPYEFHIGEWLSSKPIHIGKKVYFNIEDREAQNIELDEPLSFYLKIQVRRREGITNSLV